MAEVLTIGEPMVNLIAQADQTYVEAKTLPQQMAGAEFNVAIGVARQQHSVGYITTLGTDWQGDLIEAYMRDAGFDTRAIRRSPHNATGYQLKLLSQDGDGRVVYFRAGSAASQTTADIVDDVDFSDVKIVHVTGIFSALSPMTYHTVETLVQRAHQAGALVTFDPNPRPALWPSHEQMVEATNHLASLSDIFLPGLDEGRMFSGKHDPYDIAQFYLDLGVQTVIIKLGPKGSLLAQRNADGGMVTVIEPSFIVDVVDTVGAGDGFAAGVITATLEGLDAKHLLERANAVGAIQVTSISDSDGLPTREQLAQFIRQTPRIAAEEVVW